MVGHSIKIGNVELIALTDGEGAMPALQVFPSSTIEQWREFPELVGGDEMMHPRFGCLGVRSAGKLVIVDTGMQAPDATLMGDMKAKGIDREAVDLVVTTHLHPDHVGWNLTNGEPTFPNARYLCTKTDWDYWTQPSVMENAPHIEAQVLPLDQLNVLDLIEDEYKITDDLTTVHTPGHTPGHISIMVVSGGEKGFILGDVAHTPAQAHYTDWSPAFDVDPDLSRQTRHRIFDQLESEGTVIASGHFPDVGIGHFVREAGRRVWKAL